MWSVRLMAVNLGKSKKLTSVKDAGQRDQMEHTLKRNSKLRRLTTVESFATKKIERRADTGKVQNCRQRLKKEANQKEKNYQDCPTQQVPDTRTYSFLALSNQIFCCQLVVLAVWSGAEECSRTTVYSVQQCTAVSAGAGRRPLLLSSSSSKFSMIVAQSAVHLFSDRLIFFSGC